MKKTIMGLVFAAVVLIAALTMPPRGQQAYAASASCTITDLEATLVVDSSVATATLSAPVRKGGYIVNGGANSIFVNFMGNGVIAGSNAQNTTGEIEIPANGTVPVRPSCKAF